MTRTTLFNRYVHPPLKTKSYDGKNHIQIQILLGPFSYTFERPPTTFWKHFDKPTSFFDIKNFFLGNNLTIKLQLHCLD